MQCRHTICHQCEDAGLVSLREEYEIMREDNEKLRSLLAEARGMVGFLPTHPAGIDAVIQMQKRIDAVLGEPEVKG